MTRKIKSNSKLVGQTINGVKVLEQSDKYTKQGTHMYKCLCFCGNLFECSYHALYTKVIAGCGCAKYKWKAKSKEKIKASNGYWYIHVPNYPGTERSKGWMYYHVYVMACYLKRVLKPGEVVFHKNGDLNDNRIENLELWTDMLPPKDKRRVDDLIKYCVNFLSEYAPEYLKSQEEK